MRIPRVNSNNRIRDSFEGHTPFSLPFFGGFFEPSRRRTYLGREEQHHGCENSRDSGSDSKFAMERVERGEGSAASDAPIF